MTGHSGGGGSVLLLRFVDFRKMDAAAAANFRDKIRRAARDELRAALDLLVEQCGTMLTSGVVTSVAVALLEALGMPYQINRIDLTSGEVSYVYKNRQVDSGTGGDDYAI